MKSFAKRITLLFGVIPLGIALISCKGDTEKTKEPPNQPHEQARITAEHQKTFEQSQKKIAAKVNGIPISMQDLVEEMNVIAPQYLRPGQKKGPNTDETIKKKALDRLIYRELAVQEAKKQGLKAPKGAVEEELNQIKAEMKTEEAFRQKLLKSGITEDEMKKRIERNILIAMITEKEIFGKVTLEPEEAKKNLEKKSAEESMAAAVQKREDDWIGELKKAARIEITLPLK